MTTNTNIKLTFDNPPKIVISKKAWDKMYVWTHLAKGEVSGLGVVNEVMDKIGRLDHYLIMDVYLPIQECTGTTTDIEPEMVLQCTQMAIGDGYKFEDLRFWFHSHAEMGVFWSGTDEATAKRLSAEANFISVVMNKKSEVKGRIDLAYPMRLRFDDVSVHIEGIKAEKVEDDSEKVLAKISEVGKNIARLRGIMSSRQEKNALQILMTKINAQKNEIKKEKKAKESASKSEYNTLMESLKADFESKVKDKVYEYKGTTYPSTYPYQTTNYSDYPFYDEYYFPGTSVRKPGEVIDFRNLDNTSKKEKKKVSHGNSIEKIIDQLKNNKTPLSQALCEMQEIGIRLCNLHELPDKDNLVHFDKYPWTSLRKLIEEGMEEIIRAAEEYEAFFEFDTSNPTGEVKV